MKKRPLLVSIVAIVMLISISLSFLFKLNSLTNPFMITVLSEGLTVITLNFYFSFIYDAVIFASGIGIWQGKNWARDLFAIAGFINIFVMLITHLHLGHGPMGVISLISELINISVFLASLWVLFFSQARLYFEDA